MNTDDSGRAGCYQPLKAARIEIQRCSINISEYWRDFLPLKRVGGRNERVRRNDDFTAKTQGADSYFKRHGCVAHGHAVLHAGDSANLLLKFPDQGAVIREPPPLNQSFDPLKNLAPITDVRATDVKRFSESGFSAGNGQVMHIILVRDRAGLYYSFQINVKDAGFPKKEQAAM